MKSKQQQWDNARAKLKKIYEEKNITQCEARLAGCWRDNGLSFAHRLKRRYYTPETLGLFEETLLLCVPCHQILDQPKNKEILKYYFNKLRQ